MMTPVVAVISPGAMGAAVGKRLVGRGVMVLTSLSGRSRDSIARAGAAGMRAATDEEIASADFVLSILPPGEASGLAIRLAPTLRASNSKTVYVDCNAVNPATVERIAEVIASTGCAFIDVGIIGPPPTTAEHGSQDEMSGPRFYASGAAAPRLARLRDFGLDVRVLDGAMSAASALKMSYAGITKGTQALGAAMMLAATRAGSAEALLAELSFSQREVLTWLKRQLPGMPAKAYRWVAEMQEIAGFVADDPAARELYEGAARFYERIAEDVRAEQSDVAALRAFLDKEASGS